MSRIEVLELKLHLKREMIKDLISQRKLIQQLIDEKENEMLQIEDELDKCYLDEHNKNALNG